MLACAEVASATDNSHAPDTERASHRAHWTLGAVRVTWLACVVSLAVVLAPRSGSADEPGPERTDRPWIVDNRLYRASIDLRARVELADSDAPIFRNAEAYTLRTALGLHVKPRYGLSAYVELESSVAIQHDRYWDTVESFNERSPVPDPTHTALNQGYLRFESPSLGDLQLTGGRQRLAFDDERFIGTRSWRQNDQTYDSVSASSSLAIDGLRLAYAYVWDVRRPFGDDGTDLQRDFDSDSHIVHVSYALHDLAQVSLFAYLLDFDESPITSLNSTDTYGFRVMGTKRPRGSPWSLRYAASFAHQRDGGENPNDFRARYMAADLAIGHDRVGELGGGYELLGADRGNGSFLTPLSSMHEFNGLADVFDSTLLLGNAFPIGLRDSYVYAAPALPWKFEGRVTYHRFRSDRPSMHLGEEWDVVLERPIPPHLRLLVGGASFNGRDFPLNDIWRLWLQISFAY